MGMKVGDEREGERQVGKGERAIRPRGTKSCLCLEGRQTWQRDWEQDLPVSHVPVS